jgi:hypothetical protein
MSLPLEALETEILRLPTAERAQLLDRIIASLDSDRARDDAWDRVAAARAAALDAGDAQALPGPETIARLRARLG